VKHYIRSNENIKPGNKSFENVAETDSNKPKFDLGGH
jgi:hypothetical protein